MALSKVILSSCHIECDLCLEVFTDPRILPCGHTFCFKCLCMVAKSSEGRIFSNCVVCRTAWSEPIGGMSNLPKNYSIAAVTASAVSAPPSAGSSPNTTYYVEKDKEGKAIGFKPILEQVETIAQKRVKSKRFLQWLLTNYVSIVQQDSGDNSLALNATEKTWLTSCVNESLNGKTDENYMQFAQEFCAFYNLEGNLYLDIVCYAVKASKFDYLPFFDNRLWVCGQGSASNASRPNGISAVKCEKSVAAVAKRKTSNRSKATPVGKRKRFTTTEGTNQVFNKVVSPGGRKVLAKNKNNKKLPNPSNGHISDKLKKSNKRNKKQAPSGVKKMTTARPKRNLPNRNKSKPLFRTGHLELAPLEELTAAIEQKRATRRCTRARNGSSRS